jgi:1,4-alpha-glucan branching enzyme
MQFTISRDPLDKILTARHHNPFQVPGAHAVEADAAPVVSLRAFLPFAEQAWVLVGAGFSA